MTRSSFHRLLKRTAELLLLCSLILTARPMFGADCEIVAVKSMELKPYQDLLRGLRNASSCTVREMKLAGDDGLEAIVRMRPTAVVAIGTSVFKKLRTLRDIPVIYAMVMPSETARNKQANISGVSMDLSPHDYFTIFANVFPAAKSIAALYDPRYTAAFAESAALAAPGTGMGFLAKKVDDAGSIPDILEELRGKIDILWMLPDPTVASAETVELLLRFSMQNSIPIVTFSRKYLDMGAVASLDVDPYDMGAQTAEIANALARGTAGPLRVDARKYRLTVNRKVAAKMGITFRQDLEPGAADHD